MSKILIIITSLIGIIGIIANTDKEKKRSNIKKLNIFGYIILFLFVISVVFNIIIEYNTEYNNAKKNKEDSINNVKKNGLLLITEYEKEFYNLLNISKAREIDSYINYIKNIKNLHNFSLNKDEISTLWGLAIKQDECDVFIKKTLKLYNELYKLYDSYYIKKILDDLKNFTLGYKTLEPPYLSFPRESHNWESQFSVDFFNGNVIYSCEAAKSKTDVKKFIQLIDLLQQKIDEEIKHTTVVEKNNIPDKLIIDFNKVRPFYDISAWQDINELKRLASLTYDSLSVMIANSNNLVSVAEKKKNSIYEFNNIKKVVKKHDTIIIFIGVKLKELNGIKQMKPTPEGLFIYNEKSIMKLYGWHITLPFLPLVKKGEIWYNVIE